MILSLTGVYVDGSTPQHGLDPLLPSQQDIEWPAADDGLVQMVVSRQDDTPLDLTAGAVLLTVRRRPADPQPLFSRQGTVIDPDEGIVFFEIVAADTAAAPVATYRYDVVYVDPDGGRHQVVPVSNFKIRETVVRLDDPVTVPPSNSPLALGPSWLGLGHTPEVQTDGTTAEQLPAGYETVWNFDDGAAPLENLFLRLAAIARVTAGTALVRVRVGGTAGQPDGDLLLTLGPIAGGLPDALVSAASVVLRPVGTELVKVTVQVDTPGERAIMRGLWLRARGSA